MSRSSEDFDMKPETTGNVYEYVDSPKYSFFVSLEEGVLKKVTANDYEWLVEILNDKKNDKTPTGVPVNGDPIRTQGKLTTVVEVKHEKFMISLFRLIIGKSRTNYWNIVYAVLNDKVTITSTFLSRYVLDDKVFLTVNAEQNGQSITKKQEEGLNTDIKITFELVIKDIGYIGNANSKIDFNSPSRPHDAVILIDPEKFYVQKKVLATWSKYFNELFFGASAQKNKKEFRVGLCNSVEFLALLKVIHPSTEDEINEVNIASLMMMAEEFEMPRLGIKCGNFLMNFDMGLIRYLNRIQRKSRVISVFVLAIVLTATIAYNNAYEAKPYAVVPGFDGYPNIVEHDGDYDTHDLYNEMANDSRGNLSAKSELPRTKEKLKVFVLPFTHVDPGWLETFDVYSEDTNRILTNMHSFMTKNPAMTFMWAEFIFFERWWKNQTEKVKADVKELVTSGRLELASGSWVMTDEANAYFPVSIDNIVEGHQFLKRELGIKPSVVWSNDPFGYSNSVPYLFRQAGLKRNVINRIHYHIKSFLQKKRAIPFIWKQYFDNSSESDMLTHVLPYAHYDVLNSCGPSMSSCCEFDFKRMTHWSCPGPRPVPITAQNVKEKSETLLNQLESMSEMYQSPVILMMHGDDFRFNEIEEWHQQHDNFLPLFEEINKGDRAEIRFGTFSDYFGEMEKWYQEKKIQPASLTGDFFPYKCTGSDLWTGYFTTRPFYKRQGRLLHSFIRSGDLLFAQAERRFDSSLRTKFMDQLTEARRTLSLFQHHDAITGTSKIHVMKDYSRLLYEAMKTTRNVIEESMKMIIDSPVKLTSFPNSVNQTQSKIAVIVKEDETVYISVYNPLPHVIEDTVSIRVKTHLISVNLLGKYLKIKAQIEPYVLDGEIDRNTYLLTFAVLLQPLATTSYELKLDESSQTTEIANIYATANSSMGIKGNLSRIFKVNIVDASALCLKNAQLKTIHDENGWLQNVSTSSGNYELRQKFLLYSGSGGAYLMRIYNSDQKPLTVTDGPRLLVSGPVQNSLHLFTEKVYQRMTAKHVNGPLGAQLDLHLRINILKERNTELMMQLQSHDSMDKIYSDSVGLQLLRREPTTPSIEENYYPMPTSAIIENGKNRITVSSNVEHGLRPLKNGIEINIDRMMNGDDGKGLGSEADSFPTDLLPVDMQFSISFEAVDNKAGSHLTQHTPAGLLSVQNLLYPPMVLAGNALPTVPWYNLPSMPCDYQLVTVRPISANKKLMILYRQGAIEDGKMGKECGTRVTKTLRLYLELLGVKSVQESLLSGVDPIGEPISPSELIVTIQPYKFLTLILS